MSEIAETIVTLVLLLSCVIVACFCVLFPLVGTAVGGLRMLKASGAKTHAAIHLRQPSDPFISDLELGPTMADGGERTTEGQAAARRKRS